MLAVRKHLKLENPIKTSPFVNLIFLGRLDLWVKIDQPNLTNFLMLMGANEEGFTILEMKCNLEKHILSGGEKQCS